MLLHRFLLVSIVVVTLPRCDIFDYSALSQTSAEAARRPDRHGASQPVYFPACAGT